jgi:NADP-dependent 3-hydroxy acid dehydrogenase YdfG
MKNLKNNVIVITGASSGIGKAAALEFAKKGAITVLAARRMERLEELAKQIKDKFGTDSLPVMTDVTVESNVENLFQRAKEKFGKIDILINNAGTGLKAEVTDIQLQQWQNLMDVNLTSVFLCTKQAAKTMKNQPQGGHIITISSIAGKFGAPSYSAYCSSKHAVTGFMKAVKHEQRKNHIKCSTIHPARIDTEFFDDYKHKPGRGQMLSPKDLADFIIATAQRCPVKKTTVIITNFCKRIYYMIRFGIKSQTEKKS